MKFELVTDQKTLILIGLPSSGKTRIGKKLAKKLSFEFFDTDEIIIQKYNKEESVTVTTIQDVFSLLGQKNFRELEKQIVKDLLSKKSKFNSVISTGGGAILDSENTDSMKEKGLIIYIDTPLAVIKERIASQPERPNIGKDISSRLDQLLNERGSIMENLADIIVDGNKSVSDICRTIISHLTSK